MTHRELNAALQEFYQDCTVGYTVQSKAALTIKNIRFTWELLLSISSLDYCDDITEAILRRFFAWGVEKRKWKQMTVLTHRKNVSVFIRWAQNKGYMRSNPLRLIPKPKMPQRVPKHHTKKEIEMMFEAIEMLSRARFEELRNKAIIGVAALAGLRRGELINMQLRDIHWESKQILVKAETSKSRKERWVPISQRLESLLRDYLEIRSAYEKEDKQSLWLSAVTGGKFTTDGLAHFIGKLSQVVGFKVKLHSLRHSYGTYAYAGSHDIKAVQETMGHSDLATTMLYVNSVSEDKRHAVEMSILNIV